MDAQGREGDWDGTKCRVMSKSWSQGKWLRVRSGDGRCHKLRGQRGAEVCQEVEQG